MVRYNGGREAAQSIYKLKPQHAELVRSNHRHERARVSIDILFLTRLSSMANLGQRIVNEVVQEKLASHNRLLEAFYERFIALERTESTERIAQQDHINAKVQEQLMLMREKYDTYVNDHDKRLENLESNGPARVGSKATPQVATRPEQARPLTKVWNNFIRSAPHEELVDVVLHLCGRDHETQKFLQARFLQLKEKALASNSALTASTSGGSKRKTPTVPNFTTCITCHKDYDVSAAEV